MSAPLSTMLPLLRRRARKHGVPLAVLFSWAVKTILQPESIIHETTV